MTLLFPLVLVALLGGRDLHWQTGPARRLAVGHYRYDIALKTAYAHDEDTDNTYFVVTRPNARTPQCSALRRSVTRQGAVQTTGEYATDGDRLLFKQRYLTPRRIRQWVFPDSSVTTFSPDRTGRLCLRGVRNFSDGKATDVTY
ncbi:hypothetical protein [Hymenobacter sp. B1770]|uniref:hypothetical protein n=1 Tax=Hymenobacter sp. B1770 TaxID=1718788 RepID=UPI003CF6805B